MVTIAAVLIFGVVVPVMETIFGISADTGAPRKDTREAEGMVNRSWQDARRCLEIAGGRELAQRRFVLRASIDATGFVKSVTVIETPAYGSVANDCLIRIVRAWRFERSADERTVDLVFDPSQHAFDASFDVSEP